MIIPTEPIGSIPRPPELIAAANHDPAGGAQLDALFEAAVRETIARFEATGSPVITDGEQRKYHNFWTYCVHGAPNTAADGFQIPFADGHVRRMPRLMSAPFRYQRYADQYLTGAQRYASKPVNCGFSPFCDDRSTTRDTAFAKIGARVAGTALARALLKETA